MVIKEALRYGAKALAIFGDVAMLESSILLQKACDVDRLFLVKNRDNVLSNDVLQRFDSYIARRQKGEPIAYITGHKEFMGLDFSVSRDVLIPRPDTELLAEYAVAHAHGRVLDIGTGSGALAVSLAYYNKNDVIFACDISEAALKIARSNATAHNVNVSFFLLDILTQSLPERYDAIISNPPYIRDDVIETLDPSVRDFEPHLALSGGDDGLVFYRRITKEAKRVLTPGGLLAFEIGFDQGAEVTELLTAFGFRAVTVEKDLAGRMRLVYGYSRE